MLNHRVVLFAAPMHGVELAGLLFTDYLRSSLFQMDIAEALSDVNGWFSFFRSGFSPSTLLSFYSRLISERLFFRLLECGVSVLCMYSESRLCQDALVFQYVYPIVRDYRYGRLWCTRLLRFVGGLLYPSFLRQSRGGFSASSGSSGTSCVTANSLTRGGSASSATPRPFSQSGLVDVDVAFYRNPPRPSRVKPFDGMPEPCQEALRYYLHCYQSRPLYTIFVSGFIADVTLLVTEQIIWGSYFCQERAKRTSRWRILKPYFADLAAVSVQTTLVYAARALGVLLGQKLSREPTGGGIFWGERVTLLLLSPGIQHVSLIAGRAVRDALERRHPRTVEDELEDKRVEEEAEEAARAQAAAAHAAFAFTSVPLGSASRRAANGPGGAGVGGGARDAGHGGICEREGTNYYEVLGVTMQSKVADIKKAYRAKALLNHPDRVGKDPVAQEQARQQMSAINEAYDTLLDSEKRAQYDAMRRFSEGPEFLKRLESMTTAQLAAVSTVVVLCLGTLTAASAYGQYLTIFQRMTSLGRGPLMLFS
ncbi:conserved hypothetical protein [Leishmania infantum JPCM5]|uniref:DnaJ_domain_containing_protein_-_putative n=2 Tax=Leishmania infantum TaxID=5671 RepID=A0A6L0XR54_LEIIN|nr:conserved hypothetical protein [Leishmania infantum JPCM5]CAC9496817.1 DnaJ_domain_containing_protein_-_putative [Leishmania infantum]CAM68857.1 conserved hypothetical protein [Leishmania infantum JPCM5]SUZ42731.1 DnaJ_domain_containing_protein_-_putative [Leishmania infantum]|eukprot:XP_001470481.1 conserved hypothetical protein [Leishmania infantum JPCM5]